MKLALCLLVICAAGASAISNCKANPDCQTGGDMSGYCKTNKDCHCSAPHFSNQGKSCALACSPNDAANSCCRDDKDCQSGGDTGGYCKTLKGYNPGNGMCRCSAGFEGTTACKKSALTLKSNTLTDPNGMCSPCIQFAEQGLNILLNEILNAGVIGGCNKLCSGLKKKASKTACDVVCAVVGLKTFIKVLNNTDLDPIYFCEELGACAKGNPNAHAKIVDVAVSPPSGPSGTKFQMELEFAVTNTTGVSEIRIGVTGPTSNPVSQSFVQKGYADGNFAVNVSLDTTSDPFPPQGQDPVMWNPGSYTYKFELCQGECGSKHPGSIVFGSKTGNFIITKGNSTD